ncbi:MAG: alpha/beta hydrolase family esterase [Desulfobacterales bacterium]
MSGSGPAGPAYGKSETVKVDVREMGFRRSYRVHLPEGSAGDGKLPLLVMLHGAFETSKSMERLTGFSDLSDREKFIVVYPNGIGLFGFLQHWNAGHCCGKAQKDSVDDVAFLETVIDDVSSRFPVDPNRIYMAGHSNGGMLACLYAAEKPGRLAGLAMVSGTIGSRDLKKGPWQQIPRPAYGLPVLVIHGFNDKTIPYSGGPSSNHKSREFISVADTMAFWQSVNQCGEAAREPFCSSRRVSVRQWRPGAHRLVLHTVHDWAHDWPGPRLQPGEENSRALVDYDAAEAI